MSYFVTINGKQYRATKRRKRNGVYDVTFRNGKDKIIVHDAITASKGLVGGNGLGPFGGPDRSATLYRIKGWGSVEYVGQREFDHIANKVKLEEQS